MMFDSPCWHAEGVLYGPLHSKAAVEMFEQAVEGAKAEGGVVECGGKVCLGEGRGGTGLTM